MIQGDKHRVFVDLYVLGKDGVETKAINKAAMHPLDLAPVQSFVHLRVDDVDGQSVREFDAYIVNRTVEPRPKPGLVTYYAVEVDVIQ